MKRVDVRGLVLDPISNMPIVVLKDQGSERVLPIWVGVFEGNAISMGLDGIDSPRPMTHDLVWKLICDLKAQVGKVIIHDLQDHTFFAKIVMTHGGQTLELDSRPSDAIALAIRSESPIFVSEHVFEHAGSVPAASSEGMAELNRWLNSLGMEEPSEYEM